MTRLTKHGSFMPSQTAPADFQSRLAAYQEADHFELEAQGHHFQFYPAGEPRLEALIEFIANAECSLFIFYYMFQDDQAGTRVRDALVDAARRGVDVQLIIDAFGSDAPDSFFDPLVKAGGQFWVFSARWSSRYLIRNHQKFVIADGTCVFTGGANVADAYYSTPKDNGWCDLSASIEGPLADQFVRWFALLRAWVERDSGSVSLLRRMVKNWHPGDGTVQLLVGGPLVRQGNWVWRFKKDLIKGEKLDTVSAYFAPPRSIRRIMARLTKRGKARFVMAGKSDIDATIDVARLMYKKLLKAGSAIYEYQPSKLHLKLLVVDGACYFGSANLDNRSFRINVELMVRVEDADLAVRLRELVDHLQSASQPVTDEWYRERATFFNRIKWRLLHWFALMDYRIARSLND
ncbi:MAG: phosphatidylserine/phosphatidylglycerophosphate/cardiolipin synthase family protein [Pseudomonadota bacterium]